MEEFVSPRVESSPSNLFSLHLVAFCLHHITLLIRRRERRTRFPVAVQRQSKNDERNNHQDPTKQSAHA